MMPLGVRLSAMAFGVAFGLALAPAADAVAQEREAFVIEAKLEAQSLEVAANLQGPSATRDRYTVKVVSVVQYPLAGYRSMPPISSGFGFRNAPCWGCSSDHKGVDFDPGGGTPVEAVANGVVILSGWDGGLGQEVTIRSIIDGVVTDTLYGHMQAGSLRVAYGQSVARGTVLGLVGSTGASTGNHLHFQVEVGGVPIDPVPWLQKHANDWMW